MRRLILTQDDASSGCLKQTRLAEKVIAIPGDEPAIDGPPSHRNLNPDEICDGFTDVELWFDPLPAAQLKLARLLSLVGVNETLTSKLQLVFPDQRLGDQHPQKFLKKHPARVRVTATHIEAANLVWNAFSAPTPRRFADLQSLQLDCLPAMPAAVTRILAELPSLGTGLGATEQRLLEMISLPGATWSSVGRSYLQDAPGPVFSIANAARLVEHFGRCPAQIVRGFVSAPFIAASLPRQLEAEHFAAHLNCELSLTGLGRALIRGDADFSTCNPVDRWWGNTHLTNNNLWRYDPASRTLLPPIAV